jgi:hypothetical protein
MQQQHSECRSRGIATAANAAADVDDAADARGGARDASLFGGRVTAQ